MNTTWRKELAVMMESNMDLCDYVYFPLCYDGGSEWVGSVPRNPNGVLTMHLGGG